VPRSSPACAPPGRIHRYRPYDALAPSHLSYSLHPSHPSASSPACNRPLPLAGAVRLPLTTRGAALAARRRVNGKEAAPPPLYRFAPSWRSLSRHFARLAPVEKRVARAATTVSSAEPSRRCCPSDGSDASSRSFRDGPPTSSSCCPNAGSSFGWLGKYRRLSKDYETLTPSSECMILISMINLMVHRLSPG